MGQDVLEPALGKDGCPISPPSPNGTTWLGSTGLAFKTGVRNRVHHSYVWLGSLVGVGAAVVIGLLSNADSLFALAELGAHGVNVPLVVGLVLLGVVVLYGIVVGIAYLAYRNLGFVFDEKEFSLYSGIFMKRRVHVPYARVQSVNHRQSLVQRIAGVCTVEIDTAGGSANKAVKVPYVQLGVGEAIRSDLFVRKAASISGAEGQVLVDPAQAAQLPAGVAQGNILDGAVGDIASDFRGVYGDGLAGMEPVRFERRLDNRELLLASVSHSSVAGSVVAVAAMLAAVAAPLAFAGADLGLAGLLAVPLAIAALVLLVALSTGTVALSFGNFAVRRRGNRIEVERGLLQRDFSGIDVDRVQSIVVKQSFVRRLMGYCEVSLGRVRAGAGENQNTQAKLNSGGLVVHPFLKVDQVDGLLDSLLPEFADRPVAADFKGLPDVALRRGIVRRCVWRNGLFWTVLAVAVAQVVFNAVAASLAPAAFAELPVQGAVNMACVALYLVFAIQVAFIVVGTVWWKRGSGFAMTRRYLALCNDGLHTEVVYLPRPKVQDVLARTNPFQRMASTATIGALTAAGVGGTYSTLWDVTAEDGEVWLDWLKPHTNVVECSVL